MTIQLISNPSMIQLSVVCTTGSESSCIIISIIWCQKECMEIKLDEQAGVQ